MCSSVESYGLYWTSPLQLPGTRRQQKLWKRNVMDYILLSNQDEVIEQKSNPFIRTCKTWNVKNRELRIYFLLSLTLSTYHCTKIHMPLHHNKLNSNMQPMRFRTSKPESDRLHLSSFSRINISMHAIKFNIDEYLINYS